MRIFKIVKECCILGLKTSTDILNSNTATTIL